MSWPTPVALTPDSRRKTPDSRLSLTPATRLSRLPITDPTLTREPSNGSAYSRYQDLPGWRLHRIRRRKGRPPVARVAQLTLHGRAPCPAYRSRGSPPG